MKLPLLKSMVLAVLLVTGPAWRVSAQQNTNKAAVAAAPVEVNLPDEDFLEVESAVIRAVKYDEAADGALSVLFQDGQLVTHYGVPRKLYDLLMKQRATLGGFYMGRIANEYTTVEPEKPAASSKTKAGKAAHKKFSAMPEEGVSSPVGGTTAEPPVEAHPAPVGQAPEAPAAAPAPPPPPAETKSEAPATIPEPAAVPAPESLPPSTEAAPAPVVEPDTSAAPEESPGDQFMAEPDVTDLPPPAEMKSDESSSQPAPASGPDQVEDSIADEPVSAAPGPAVPAATTPAEHKEPKLRARLTIPIETTIPSEPAVGTDDSDDADQPAGR